jgi:hypothetical protein
MWIGLTILFFLISIFTSVLVYYSLRRITQYEELILEIQQVIKFSTEKMKLVDAKGHYESDDETGFFFEQLKQIQLSLDGKSCKKEKTKSLFWTRSSKCCC